MLQVDRQNSFARGMRDSAAPTEYAQDEVASLLNGRPSRVGNSLEPRRGSQKTHAEEINNGAIGYGGIEYSTADRDQNLVVVAGNTWYSSDDDGETWTAIPSATGYSLRYWSMVLMRVGGENRVIGANGGDHPVSWNGSDPAIELSNWPDGIKFLAVMNDRLYGCDGSITVLGSKVSDPATLTTADGGLSVQAQAHDDDPEITGLWTHGVILLVFKRRSMGYIEGYGYNTITVQTGDRGMSRSVGCIAHRSLAPAGDGGVCWLSDRGLEYLGPGSTAPQLVSQPIQGFMDEIDFAAIQQDAGLPCAIWWQAREEYWLAVPTLGSANRNSHFIVFRPGTEQRPPAIWLYQGADLGGGTIEIDSQGIFQYRAESTFNRARIVRGVLELDEVIGSFWQIDDDGILQLADVVGSAASMWVADRGQLVNRPHLIGYDGFVRHMEVGERDDVESDGTRGVSIQAKIRSRPFIFGDPMRNKAPASVRISALPPGSEADMTVRLYGDGEQIQRRRATIVRGSATRPRPTRIRMGGGRASAVQIEIQFEGRFIVQALEAAVRLLDETP